jgi:hypothetical protein
VSWFALAWLLVTSCQLRADNPTDLARVRPTLERKLRDPSAAVRLDAVGELARYSEVDAATLILPRTRDADARVRHAALGALVRQQGEPQVRAWMVKKSQGTSESSAVLVGVLLAGTQDPQELLDFVDKAFKKDPERLVTLFPVIEEFGTWQDRAAVRALTHLTRLKCFPDTLGLQRTVVTALIGVRHRDAVPVLIDLMARLEGELLAQIGAHLNKVTGKDYEADAAVWKKWWQQNNEQFEYPSSGAAAGAKNPKPDASSPRYYGLPIYAKRVAFVIDTSGSMLGPKIINAKKELVGAIQRLPAGSEFNIIVFNSRVYVWSPKPVEATDDAKKRATAYVVGLPVGGSTVTYDALKAALDLRIESIYLLTDGEPTRGQIVRPDQIVTAIRAQNRLLGVSIHCIGLSVGPDNSICSMFLKALAEQNNGQYRKVD